VKYFTTIRAQSPTGSAVHSRLSWV
jgi:hypothetical protein